MKVAIIGGSGRMGRWLARFLLKDGQDVVAIGRNKSRLREVKQQLGIETATSLDAIKTADVVLISVPMDSFEAVVKQLSPYLRPEQIILDITSIKATPVEVMHRYIKTGKVLGTHPMFGPGAKDLSHQNVVLTPTSKKETALAQRVKQYLEARGARAALMTPQEHDEMMAVVLGLAHFIALVSADALLSFDKLKQMEKVGGTTYRLLLTLAESVLTEDAEFYASLQMNLPKMPEIHGLFQKKARAWASLVKSKDSRGFIERIDALKDKLAKSDPDFKRAYENMYRLLGG
ncbi:MAG: prephenate dehydrogenase [Dehalococcoidales bacterium]|nr:prephenate dehydrogenase [Dehalococcoidales bacterium]